MTTSIRTTRLVALVLGAVQLVLGILFWAHIGRNLIPVHILIGSLFVVTIWVLAFLCSRAGAAVGAVLVLAGWGLVVLLVGLDQGQVLHGALHWIVQAIHLLVGVVAITLAGVLPNRLPPRGVAANRNAADPVNS